MSKVVKEYLKFSRIISKSENVKNSDVILQNNLDQIFIGDSNCLEVKGKGFIILDVGYEICGGIRIVTAFGEGNKFQTDYRIRCGESLMECCSELKENNSTNDHAMRDIKLDIAEYGSTEILNTGYRFVRIDFLNDERTYLIKSINAVSYLRDLECVGSFECDDELVNQIFLISRRTLQLCMQNYLWDGIKRDRLVWVGDMQPEVLGSTYIYGATDIVEESLIESEKHNPLPVWFGSIPTYSAWFIKIIADYYLHTGNEDFTKDRIQYINGVLKQIDESVSDDGNIDYSKASPSFQRGYFIDWPSSECKNLKEANRFLLIYILEESKKILQKFEINKELIEKILFKLRKYTFSGCFSEKQLTSFQVLSNEVNAHKAYSYLIEKNAHGLSTYMSHFILSAISIKNPSKAIEIMKEYYGGMLSLGATSFFEDFDVDWLANVCKLDEFATDDKIDFHGSKGKFCYKGYRHSFCHGWSCGPIQFLFENILGLEILEPGYKKIKLSPKFGIFKIINAKIPTPYGPIFVNIEGNNLNIKAPKDIQILK